MNAASVDIKDLMDSDSSLGLVFGTDLFCFREPAKPDNVVTIFDTPGDPAIPVLKPTDGSLDRPSLQIRIRNKDAREAFILGNEIVAFLHGYPRVTINNTEYTMIKSLHPPYILDWDENNRIRIVLNFDLHRVI